MLFTPETGLTADQRAAIVNANNANALNPFAVKAQVDTKQPAVRGIISRSFYGQSVVALDTSYLNQILNVGMLTDQILDLPAAALSDVPAVLYVTNRSNAKNNILTLRDGQSELVKTKYGQTAELSLVKQQLGPDTYRASWILTNNVGVSLLEADEAGLLPEKYLRETSKAAFLRAGGILNRPLVLNAFGGYNNGFSDGSALAKSFWFEPNAPLAASALQLLFGNFSIGSSYAGGPVNPGQVPGPNPITVKAAIYNGDDLFPFTFNGGQPSARILPGMTILTDRLMRVMKPGAGSTVLQVSVAVDNLGQKWPLGITSRNSAAGDAIGQSFNNGPALSYHPIAVMGDLAQARTYGSVALVTDSIGVDGGGADLPDLGWPARALNAVNICWTRMGTYGALLDTYTRLDKLAVALPAISGVEHVLCNLGANNMLDLLNGGLDAMKTRYLALWAALGATGAKVHQSTITPYDNTSAGFVALKGQLNDWFRTVPAGLTSCVDAALAAETAKNSNLWKPGYTNDGLHPNETGATAIAAAVNPAIFLL